MSRAIAIDGPAASGKSSVAQRLSEHLTLIMVNSGAMYRAVAWKVLQESIDPLDAAAVNVMMERTTLECGVDRTLSTVGYDGCILTTELKSKPVNAAVSHIAKIPEVRTLLLHKQRAYLKRGDVVMEGRDIGTVVFPETPYKFFFQASPEIRQARREAEGLHDSVVARDQHDSNRNVAPLRPAPDAVLIETGDVDLEGVLNRVLGHLKKMGWEG